MCFSPVRAWVGRNARSDGFTALTSRKQSILQSTQTSEALLQSLEVQPQDESKLASYIEGLERSQPTDITSTENGEVVNFDPLLGLYEVSYVKTKKKNDNPVGGKWTRKTGLAQKILRTRRSFQHILPVNATGLGGLFGEGRKVVGEAVNVISLDAFWGLLRMSVILRGDAIPLSLEERTNTTRVIQPLSSLAIKALFDPPRIVVGRRGRLFNINVGPKTSVLLDTLYCDNILRLGMGGTSGSRFVFRRCPDEDEEANEFRSLLARPPMKKQTSLLLLGSIASLGVFGVARGFLRILSGTTAVFATIVGALIAFSGGGIERGDMGVTMRKEGEMSAQSTSGQA